MTKLCLCLKWGGPSLCLCIYVCVFVYRHVFRGVEGVALQTCWYRDRDREEGGWPCLIRESWGQEAPSLCFLWRSYIPNLPSGVSVCHPHREYEHRTVCDKIKQGSKQSVMCLMCECEKTARKQQKFTMCETFFFLPYLRSALVISNSFFTQHFENIITSVF